MLLDEAGEMTRMQGLLLRSLETGELQKVGSDRSAAPVNVSVVFFLLRFAVQGGGLVYQRTRGKGSLKSRRKRKPTKTDKDGRRLGQANRDDSRQASKSKTLAFIQPNLEADKPRLES